MADLRLNKADSTHVRNQTKQHFMRIRWQSSSIYLFAFLHIILLIITETSATNSGWSLTGNTNYARVFHTASVLTNTKILVAGGDMEGSNNSESYDPATGVWTNAGNMNYARAFHTASVLTNGKVLVAGGYPGFDKSYINYAEVYDSTTGVWTNTGRMNHARTSHTATVLTNGKVLVVGGLKDSHNATSINYAEVYDPATGVWTNAGRMNHARAAHTATLLKNGKVLVAGGIFLEDNLNSSELYDSATGMWTTTGNMNYARSQHTASLLTDGKILVAGGYPAFHKNEINYAEVYDPSTGVWTNTGSMSYVRIGHTATVLNNGKVLVAGGVTVSPHEDILNSSELYDPATAIWTFAGNMKCERVGHTASLLADGRVLVAGGTNGHFDHNSTELYQS